MSKRIGKGYKNWMNPNTSSTVPRTTEYRRKKQKLQDIVHEGVDVSESEDETLFEVNSPQKLESEASQEINNTFQDALEIENENNQLYQAEVTANIEMDEDYNWIDVFMNNERRNAFNDSDIASNERNTENNVNTEEEIKLCKKIEENITFFNEKLRRRTNVTYGEVILMCILIGLRHSLSWLAMLDILNLINKLFAEDTINFSKYKLLNVFPENKEWLTYHIYCPKCNSYIGSRSNLNNVTSCPSCGAVIQDVKKAPSFLTLNLKAQFKQLFENPSVSKHLHYRFNRQKINRNSIEDIYDGELYKFLSSPGNILQNKWNISYVLNTDGCQTSNSSKISAWPVYLKINELPQHIRNKYMILAGIWVNEGKPLMNTFLQPIVKELNTIATEGVQWIMNKEIIVSKIIPLCCSVDSVARCSLLNMKQFNGLFGCTFCYHPTENVEGMFHLLEATMLLLKT